MDLKSIVVRKRFCPLLKNANLDSMKILFDSRTPIYKGCADFTVKTDDKDVDGVAREIVKLVGLGVEV